MKVHNSVDGSTGKMSLYKDNQIKLTVNGLRFETDGMGYEGLSEYLCSELIAFTNIESYARYEMTEMELNDERFNGCMSKDFLNEGEEIITADKLFKTYLGMSVQEFLKSKSSLEERIASFVNEVERITGIKDYGKELTKVLEWDTFVLNDDRHFNNIAFIYNSDSKEFFPCVLFDNGAAFLSDMRCDYPLEKNVYGLIANVKAKPFSEDFDKQVKACEKLYGIQLVIDQDIYISKEVEQKIRNQYGDKIADRVCDVFEHQKWISDYLCDLKASGERELIMEFAKQHPEYPLSSLAVKNIKVDGTVQQTLCTNDAPIAILHENRFYTMNELQVQIGMEEPAHKDVPEEEL